MPPAVALKMAVRPRFKMEAPSPRPPSEGPPPRPPPSTSLAWAGIIVALFIGGAVALRVVLTEDESATGAPSSASASVSELPPRCRDLEGQWTVGKETKSPDGDDRERDELISPFAAIVGRAAAGKEGAAVGVLVEGEGGTVAEVVKLAPGGPATTVRLARSRSDMDPPTVVIGPSGQVFGAMMEPNASERAIRVFRIEGDQVTWGAELREGRDASLAVDLALSGETLAVVWDSIDNDEPVVRLATFDRQNFGPRIPARRVTPKGAPGNAPRIVARPSGYYLAYLVSGAESPRMAADNDALREGPSKKKIAPTDEGDVDESIGGEALVPSRLEVVPLDDTGAQVGDPLPISKHDETVIGFDLMATEEGGLLVVYRDDDAPTGSARGPLRWAKVEPGSVVAKGEFEDLPIDGLPTLMPGWLGLPTLSGPDYLGELGADGSVTSPPGSEPSLGRGEPIAALGSKLLLTEPMGKAMQFRFVECTAGLRPPAEPLPAEPSASASTLEE